MRKRRHRSSRGIKRKAVIFGMLLAVFIAAVVSVTVFRVSVVTITGNERFTDEEIEKLVLQKPYAYSTLFMSLFRSDFEVPGEPLIDSIQVKKVSGQAIRIQVNERQIIGYVDYLDCHVYFDGNGVVVDTEVIKDASAKELNPTELSAAGDTGSAVLQPEEKVTQFTPHIEGLDIRYVQMNKKLPVGEDKVFNTILSLDKILIQTDQIPDRIAFDPEHNILLYFDDIQVNLGQDKILEEKISVLDGIYPKIEGKAGVLSLDSYDTNGAVIFKDETGDVVEETEGVS